MILCRESWRTLMPCCAAASSLMARLWTSQADNRCSISRRPARDGTEALHSFDWLPPLALAGGEAARILTTNLVAQWIKRHGRYSEPAWSPAYSGMAAGPPIQHGRMVVLRSEMTWRSKVVRLDARTIPHAGTHLPGGTLRVCRGWKRPRLWCCRPSAWMTSSKRLDLGLKRLEEGSAAPDPARWQPCRPVTGISPQCLSLPDHGA